jgi:hypothetical protein
MVSPSTGIADSPARRANQRRNDQTGFGRHRRWRAARDAAWTLVARHLAAGDHVAIVGAGNGEDLPLRAIARRAGVVDLIDLDAAALRRARRRTHPWARRVRCLPEDVTAGAADAAVTGRAGATVPDRPLGDGPYDLVIADLLYTQLLYPALLDSGASPAAIGSSLRRDGQALTDAVVRRLRATARGGTLIHLNDVMGWWDGHEQPFGIEDALADPGLVSRGVTPTGCGVHVQHAIDRAAWRWPFAPGTDYLVHATVERG